MIILLTMGENTEASFAKTLVHDLDLIIDLGGELKTWKENGLKWGDLT